MLKLVNLTLQFVFLKLTQLVCGWIQQNYKTNDGK
jgi:hypothetical protein